MSRPLLRRGCRDSEDIAYLKGGLVTLGFLDGTKNTRSIFGGDTERAVRAFQRANGLEPDGLVGAQTWAALEARLLPADEPENPELDANLFDEIPEQIGETARGELSRDLTRVTAKRQDIVLDALRFAFDPAVPSAYPTSLYIRGANLYTSALRLYTPTYDWLMETYAARYPAFCTGDSLEMMGAACNLFPGMTGADCSGGIVGLLRCHCADKIAPTFDRSANQLLGDSHSAAVVRNALLPGDWVGRPGHIGLYAGGGYAVEWIGPGFGCALTLLDGRRAYCFASCTDASGRQRYKAGQTYALSEWTQFRRPNYY